MTPTDPRDRILDAAETAFAERGLAGARVNAIADVAGVNKAMLYYYFGSKDELYRAVLTRTMDQVVGRVSTELDRVEHAPSVRMEAMLDAYREVLRAHPLFARIMARELAEGAPLAAPLLRERLQPVLPRIQATMAQAAASGDFNPRLATPLTIPVMVAPLIFAALAGPIIAPLFGDGLDEAYYATAKEVLLNGLRTREDRS
ncbi:MAG: TetR family transcriptional regulator [Deltaproteobacteria bacterium]|nr:TetR family transcriptional regulator [Deltaproteobacteria bacterium]